VHAKDETLFEVFKALEAKADEDQDESIHSHQSLTTQFQHVFGSAGV
jgi:hypothetical protein